MIDAHPVHVGEVVNEGRRHVGMCACLSSISY